MPCARIQERWSIISCWNVRYSRWFRILFTRELLELVPFDDQCVLLRDEKVLLLF